LIKQAFNDALIIQICKRDGRKPSLLHTTHSNQSY
jgi:hypothetical protein